MTSSHENPVATYSIHLTQPAIAQVRKLMQDRELDGYALRVFISRGGCSGFQYGMGLEEKPQEGDHRFEFDDVDVLIDPVSINYLSGATIDYHEDLMGGGFRLENPNAISSCGCGNSFKTENSGEVENSSGGDCCS